MKRRTLLQAPLAAISGSKGIRRELFLRSPGNGVAVMAYAYYMGWRDGGMMSIEQRWSRSDTIDVAYYRYSRDYGRTWGTPVERPTSEKRPEGMLRRHPRGCWVDPVTGRYVEFWLEGILPNDDPLEGLRQWNIYYKLASGPIHQVIHAGDEFNARHPLPGVYTGKNCVMLGDQGSRPITSSDDAILMPVDITPLDSEGKLYNPGGGYTYHDTAVLIGRWQYDRIEWRMSSVVKGDPKRSTRGMSEPTIAALDKTRYLLVMRGSNDRHPELPSYRWTARSTDGGKHWTEPVPWTYTGGSPFFSPSSCSQLLSHSNGRLYWLGNITPENPKGNRPRWPFVIAEVDRVTGLLIKDSLRIVDTLAPGEDPVLSLSNFFAREDRRTQEICVHMTRLFARDKAWEGDAMLYRIEV